MGTNQYLIERGAGYQQVENRGINSLVSLSKNEAGEFLAVLDVFGKEAISIQNVSSKLLKYYHRTNRQNLCLRIAGYLHKHQVPEYLTCELVFHLIEITGDEEPVQRKAAIRDTYVKDANTDQVSGRIKLLEAGEGDESVIVVINQELGKLGYHFNGNENTNKKTDANKPGVGPGPNRNQKIEEKRKNGMNTSKSIPYQKQYWQRP